jgi:hypothetical protein
MDGSFSILLAGHLLAFRILTFRLDRDTLV